VSHRAAVPWWCGLALLLLSAAGRAAEAPTEEKFRPPRNEETYRAIVAAARESNRDVRARVAWVLGQTGREDAVPVLERLLNDPAPEVRAAALRALCELVPAGKEVPFAPDVPIKEPTLRVAALTAAAQLRFPQRRAVIDAAMDSGRPSERALAARALRLDTPKESRPALLKLLEDSHPLVRAAAVETLGAARDNEAVTRVLRALAERGEPDSFAVRAAACRALAEMRTERGLDELHQAVSDEHYFVRRSAIEAIMTLEDLPGVPAIQQRITDHDYTVRVAACRALGKLVDPTSPPHLAARLADEVPEVRQAADDALVTFPPDLAYKALLEWVDYKGLRETRRRVWRILGEYGHPGTREVAWAHVQPEDEDVPVRVAALKILRKLADRRIIPLVTSILQTPNGMMNRNPPPEGMVEESFKAGALFKLPEGTRLGKFILYRAQIMMPDDGYMPSPATVVAVFEYFAALKRLDAVPAMERVFDFYKIQRDDTLLALKKALEELTGRTYELPPPVERAKPFGAYFIDIRPHVQPLERPVEMRPPEPSSPPAGP